MNNKSSNKKVVLWIILFIIVAGFAGCVGLVRWVKNSAPEFEEVMSQAQEFGKQTDENGCLQQALSSQDECQGFRCNLKASIFFSACLPASKPSNGFCDHAPAGNSIKKQAEWSLAKCKQLKRDDQMCVQLMTHVSNHCNSELRRAKTFENITVN